jgi:hypothetical protein
MLDRLLKEQIMNPFIYTKQTIPTFFFNEYKIAIIADLSKQIQNLTISNNK